MPVIEDLVSQNARFPAQPAHSRLSPFPSTPSFSTPPFSAPSPLFIHPFYPFRVLVQFTGGGGGGTYPLAPKPTGGGTDGDGGYAYAPTGGGAGGSGPVAGTSPEVEELDSVVPLSSSFELECAGDEADFGVEVAEDGS